MIADGDDLHANRGETSVMLAVAPELVDHDEMMRADDPDRTADLVFRYTAPSLSTNGVTGRPSEATPELGRMLLERTADALAGMVERGRVEEPPLGPAPFPTLTMPPAVAPTTPRGTRHEPPERKRADHHREELMDTVQDVTEEHRKLAADLGAQGVEYVVGAYVDILGRSKSKVVPIEHLPNLLAGSERYTPRGIGDLGQMTPNEDECVAMPDLSTLRIMPWDRRFAWMAADLLFGGTEPFAHCTRSVLKREVDRAAGLGFGFNLGVETEIYAYKPDAIERDRLPRPDGAERLDEADARLRRRGDDGRDAVPRPDGRRR